jgi:group II intron reverse transcriptase/maturase
VFHSLAYLIDVEFLKEAYRRTRKDSSPGIDGVTAEEYARNLDENIRGLHERLRTQRYKAPPVVRGWVPKEDGTERPIGKPSFEDKIVQRAVAMLLTAVYEEHFYTGSYGFREGRSQHQALGDVWQCCTRMGIRWIVDADIKGYFDSIPHAALQDVIRKRVNDGGLLRLIGKWLKAGVWEDGELFHPETGTPQGGVISPVLSNIYLHEVLDEWFVNEIRPRLKGRSFLVRFADDFVFGCELEEDARRVLAVLSKRFDKHGLTIHPEKTRLMPFGKPTPTWRHENGTFDFLGFTHYWGKSRRGQWAIKRKTRKKRLRKAIDDIWHWCRDNRHRPIEKQHEKLCQKLNGHINYYGVRGNFRALQTVVWKAQRAWRYWLHRRGGKNPMPWERFAVLLDSLPLPKAAIVAPCQGLQCGRQSHAPTSGHVRRLPRPLSGHGTEEPDE